VGAPSSPLHFIFRPHKEKGWTEWEWVYRYIKCSVTGHTTLMQWPTSTTLESSDSGNTCWSKPGNRWSWDSPCALEKETTRWCVCAGLVCSLVEIVCAAALGYAFKCSVSEVKLISFLDLCGFFFNVPVIVSCFLTWKRVIARSTTGRVLWSVCCNPIHL